MQVKNEEFAASNEENKMTEENNTNQSLIYFIFHREFGCQSMETIFLFAGWCWRKVVIHVVSINLVLIGL